jgi:nicotinamide mononucleotide transporter
MNHFLSTYGLDLMGTLIGLVYVYQEYKADIRLWITGIIMPVVYMFVYLKAGLYADFGMQIYYALAAIYGFILWKWGAFFQSSRKGKQGKEQIKDTENRIGHFPTQMIIPSTLLFLASWGLLYWILANYTNSTVPVLDSFGNALSFIGLWALARKYIEQWWIWIIVDAELSALYVYKNLPFTAILYALYVIIAIAGYYKWKKMMAHETQQQN